ncbi:trigger factor [Streptococcus pyogenes M1 476]|nr:RecName: Full=Trigger factor; Short=TF; AltName: Full=PPIase [Streptococcus pyogenes MGAS10750]Q48RE9.1 RecName: Full=Trigger factor; Short=TF; AltName: Full=PPIase [Streptococcus pyogenes MGAS6180]AAT87755.1 Trigger factor, ppiase [Streptococcus pyogenes MGAS10394]AGQ28179.1 trigger factor [Streptococcus pyogenes HSC5]BAM31007.2 trigger factor [Streptococcus pyogenes M1 476]AAX72711.1 trigger factor, ppiase [Streptococcus pyogenes MGAS6180]ABF38617.1 Trigger factor, ppiase [Streptococcus 
MISRIKSFKNALNYDKMNCIEIILRRNDLMSTSFENKATNRGVITFTISQDKIKPALDKAFNKIKKDLNAPGFRKGHMPRPVFNQKFGEEVLYEDALNIVLPEAYEAAVTELGLDVVAQPKIDVVSMEKGKEWTLSAEVVTKPEVKLGDYKNLVVEVDASKEVSDEDVDAKIERERQNLAELIIKDGEAAQGDTVVIDFVGSVDGVEFDGGKGDNFSLELGSGQFIPGFEDQLVGAKAGDEVEVNVTFPESYQAEDLAGKAAKFMTTIHEVKTKEVPELDDELAKDIDEDVDTLEDLKVKYRKELEAAQETAYDDAVEGAAIELAVANAEIVDLPEEMIHEEVNRSVNEFMGNMQRQGISPEMYFQLTGTTQEDLHNQYSAEADKRVKTNLVIEAIAKAEGFEATDSEIEQEINDLATEYNMPADQVRSLLSADMLKHDIAMKKAVEVITSTASVK